MLAKYLKHLLEVARDAIEEESFEMSPMSPADQREAVITFIRLRIGNELKYELEDMSWTWDTYACMGLNCAAQQYIDYAENEIDIDYGMVNYQYIPKEAHNG